MIIFKNQLRKGFVFIEVITALAIIALSVTTFLILEQRVLYRTVFNTNKIERLPLLQNMFALIQVQKKDLIDRSASSSGKSQEEKMIILEKKYTDPETTVIYERMPLDKHSSLARFKGLYKERVTARWHEDEVERMADIQQYGFELQESKE